MSRTMKSLLFVAALPFAASPAFAAGTDSRNLLADSSGSEWHADGAARIGHARASGVITSIDAAAGKLVIEHDAVASLQWPRMQMPFSVSVRSRNMLQGLKPGDRVQFTFVQRGPDYVITWLQ